MKRATVIALTNSYAIDFEAPGAAMRLAWKWTAQELWRARMFDTDHRAIFASSLRAAWVHVKKIQANRRRDRDSANDPRVLRLRDEYTMLQNRSFSYSIRNDQARIQHEIQDILDSI